MANYQQKFHYESRWRNNKEAEKQKIRFLKNNKFLKT
jgi:hypothetical protein